MAAWAPSATRQRCDAKSSPAERRAITAKVFVGNLSYQTTEHELREHLSQAGTIVDLYLATDRETGRPRGFAFCTYSSEEEARLAIQKFNGEELSGRRLNVNEAQERPRGPRPPRNFEPPPMDDFDGGWDGGGGGKQKKFKSKGSRRGLRARKRSL